MKFDTPASPSSIDQLKVIGQPHDRVEGRLKVTGTATFAYEHHDVVGNVAYGYALGIGIAKGRISSIDLASAKAAPGVIAVITYENAGQLGKGEFYVQRFLAGPEVDHYHQVAAVVVAETFEQARYAAGLIRIAYQQTEGSFDLAGQWTTAPVAKQGPYGGPTETALGHFDKAFAEAPVTVDEIYTTPAQAHAMMEPHATIASWEGDKLTCWTSIQQMNWGTRDLAKTLGIPKQNVRLISPYIGGGFGGKGTAQADLVMAALAARAARRPVKLALQRTLMSNNTIHRPATIQRIRTAQHRTARSPLWAMRTCRATSRVDAPSRQRSQLARSTPPRTG